MVSASDLNETAGDEIQVSNAIEVEQYADESPINEETNVDDDLINNKAYFAHKKLNHHHLLQRTSKSA